MKTKTSRKLLVFVIIIAWFLSGWPQVWNFPPEIRQVRAAEYLSNPSFTGGETDWTLSTAVYNGTTYQDTAGSIETTSGVGRNKSAIGTGTQTISTSINSSDTVNLSLYWQKTWVAIASARQNLEVQIKKPSMGDWTTPTTIYSETTVYQGSGWTSVGPTNVSSYFDETGTYEIRFMMDVRNGNNGSAETHIWVDNAQLDVTGPAFSISLITDGSVSFPTLALEAIEDTTISGIDDVETVSVDSGPADLDVRSTAFTEGGNTWTLGTSNGATQVKWESSEDGSAWTTFEVFDTLYALDTNVGVGQTRDVYLRITMPTSTNSYSQYSSTVTVVASTP